LDTGGIRRIQGREKRKKGREGSEEKGKVKGMEIEKKLTETIRLLYHFRIHLADPIGL